MSPLAGLLWEGLRWLKPGLAVADRCYKALVMALGSVERVRAREGALVRFTGFEVLRIERPEGWAWPRQPAGDEVKVVFEMGGRMSARTVAKDAEGNGCHSGHGGAASIYDVEDWQCVRGWR
jgi:hypothetical protein